MVEPSDHRVIDVLVLFFLHSIGGRRKSVETMISAKIRGGCFNDDLLSAVLGSHAKVDVCTPPTHTLTPSHPHIGTH